MSPLHQEFLSDCRHREKRVRHAICGALRLCVCTGYPGSSAVISSSCSALNRRLQNTPPSKPQEPHRRDKTRAA
eukprot:35502-Eustigmatos_ZCMA.PRE.1